MSSHLKTPSESENIPEALREMKDLQPLQYLRELFDKRLSVINSEGENPRILLWRFRIIRAFAKLIKPLFRFENLFSYEFRSGIEMMTAQSMTPDVWVAMSPGQTAFRQLADGVFDCVDNRARPLVWIEWCLSTDLIFAFDAQPFIPEALVALLIVLRLEYSEKLIDFAEQAGVPPEYCSAARSSIGSYLAGQLPEPDCIVTVSHPCDSMTSSYQTLEYLTDVPIYRLDTPYWDDERSLDYYANDVRRLIAFLEENLNRKLDYDRLREVLTEVNKTNELLMETNEMYRAMPCPGSGMTLVMGWFFRELGRGSPELTEMARRMHEVARKRMEAGRGAVKKEKIRVIWFDVPIAFYPLIIWMEETFGAVVVMDLVGYVDTPPIDTSSPDSMIRGLAASYMNLTMARHFHGPIELFHRDLYRVCEDYNGDCFIYAGHVGCKHGWASVRLLKEHMKKINMPLLVLASDIFDRRLTTENQLKAQIEEFFVSNGLV